MAYTTINKSSLHMNTKLYTGNGSTGNAQTGIGFQPDFVWLKSRTNTEYHNLYDSVRGATKRLVSNLGDGESTISGLTSFNSDGFTVGSADTANQNSQNFVAWNWKAGGSASANTDGSLSSSVSANQTSGFSIVTYNGRDATDTIGHGLGAEPSVILFKCRSHTGSDWYSYWKPLGNNSTVRLNNIGAEASPTGLWNTTSPTSSVFTVISSDVINRVGRTFVAYCFAEKTGYSKIGKYTGNGNADGTFVYTGFKPAWLMVFNYTAGNENWIMVDNKRDGFNVENEQLFPNTNIAEESNDEVDLLSNGFKLRRNNTRMNGSLPYIYMAFSEAPLVGSNNVPCTAR
jgi:hypothetical protein